MNAKIDKLKHQIEILTEQLDISHQLRDREFKRNLELEKENEDLRNKLFVEKLNKPHTVEQTLDAFKLINQYETSSKSSQDTVNLIIGMKNLFGN